MKTQTFISVWKDTNGKTTNFERWAYKRLNTVVNKTAMLMQHPIYRKDNEASVAIEFYATPDGFTKETVPSKTCTIQELLTLGKTLA